MSADPFVDLSSEELLTLLEDSSRYKWDAAAGIYVDRFEVAQRFGAGSLNGADRYEDAPRRVVLQTLRQILEDPTAKEPPVEVVPRIAWRERLTMLAGREKDGKTTMAAAGAAAVSRGRIFLRQNTVAGVVLWVGLEEHVAEIARRFVHFKADLDRIVVVTALPNELRDLESAVDETQPVLVVIDTLPALVARLIDDAFGSANWTPIMHRLTAIARTSDAALLLLHHARKSDGKYRDSTAIGANVDMILEMQGSPEDPTLRRFTPKGRWPEREFSIRYTGEGFELATGGLSMDTKVLFYIQEHLGCSLRAVRDGVTGANDEIDLAIARLIRAHAVVDDGDDVHHRYRAVSGVRAGVPSG